MAKVNLTDAILDEGLDALGNKITNVATPTDSSPDTDAVNKGYVDSVVTELPDLPFGHVYVGAGSDTVIAEDIDTVGIYDDISATVPAYANLAAFTGDTTTDFVVGSVAYITDTEQVFLSSAVATGYDSANFTDVTGQEQTQNLIVNTASSRDRADGRWGTTEAWQKATLLEKVDTLPAPGDSSTGDSVYLTTGSNPGAYTFNGTIWVETGGAEQFSDLSGSIGFGQFPAGGSDGQVLKSTGDPGVVEWGEDTSEIAARVVISGINVNQVAGTPSETLITFASAQEAAEFAATNSIVSGQLTSTITFTLTHDGDVYNYSIPSGGTPPQSVAVSGNTISFQPQVAGVVEVHGATSVVDHTFDHLASGNLNQLTFVDADTARYDVISETVLTDSDAVLPTSGAVHDYVESKFLRDGTPAVQYWEVDGLPNGGPSFTGDDGSTVEEVLEFSDFRTDDSFRTTFDIDNAPIRDTIAFSINNVGDAATAVNNGDWTVAIEDRYKAIFTKNGQTVTKTLIKGDGSASVVSTELLCLAFDPMKIPGDTSRAGEKIYIGTENETVLVIDLNQIDFSEGDGTITTAVAKYGLRGSLTPSSVQINITALGVHYTRIEHLSVTRWIQTVVFGTSAGSLPWISAEVGEGDNFSNFLDLEDAETEAGTTATIFQSSNDQNNTYETQRGYTLDGGIEFEFAHASVRSIEWAFDADGRGTMIAVGDSILRSSQSNSSTTERTPLFAIGQYWGIPMGPLAEQYFGDDTPTNRQTLFQNLEFSPLTYLGVVSGARSGASIYPDGFKAHFLHDQSDVVLTDFSNLDYIHLKDIIYQQGTGAGFYIVGDRITTGNQVHGIGLFVDFQEFSLVTYNRDNTYLEFEKGLPDERSSRVKVIENLTKLTDNDNAPYTKLYLRNGAGSDRNIVAFGQQRQALEINTTVTTGTAAFARSTVDQFEDLVNNNDGPFRADADTFWGGFIPNKNDFSRVTVLWGDRRTLDVPASIFIATRIQQEIVEIKFFDHSDPTAGPTLRIPKTNGEDIRSFASKFVAHFGPGQTFPNGTAELIPAVDPGVSEAAITVIFDPDTTKDDDFTITVHVNNFNLLQPVNAGQTQYSLPITESFNFDDDADGNIIFGYQLPTTSFDNIPGFNFSVFVGGVDVTASSTLVGGLLQLDPTVNASATTATIIQVNYLEASDNFYDFNEDLATRIDYLDPYSGTHTIRGSFKISLDHTFTSEDDVASFIASELQAAGVLTDSVEVSVIGTELIFEIGINSKGPIVHDSQKISIVTTNPVLDPVNADPLMITRRLNGETDEPGSEAGPIDLSEVPSRDEMIDFIEAAVEGIEGGEPGITELSLRNATEEFVIDALDASLLTAADPIATQAYVDQTTGADVRATARAIEIDNASLTSQVDSGVQQTQLAFSSNADFHRFLTNAGAPTDNTGFFAAPAFTFFLNNVSYTVAAHTWIYDASGGAGYEGIRWNATNLPQPSSDIINGTYHRLAESSVITSIVEGENINFGITSNELVISAPEVDLSTIENDIDILQEQITGTSIYQDSLLTTYEAGQTVSDSFLANYITQTVTPNGTVNYVLDYDAIDDVNISNSGGVNIVRVTGRNVQLDGLPTADFTFNYTTLNDLDNEITTSVGVVVGASTREYLRRGTPSTGIVRPRGDTYVFLELPDEAGQVGRLGVYASNHWILILNNGQAWRPYQQYLSRDEVEYRDINSIARHAYAGVNHTSLPSNNPAILSAIDYSGTGAISATTPWTPIGASIDFSTGSVQDPVKLQNPANVDVVIQGTLLGVNERLGQWGVQVGTSLVDTTTVSGLGNGDMLSFGLASGTEPTSSSYEIIDVVTESGVTQIYFRGDSVPAEIDTLTTGGNLVSIYEVGSRIDLGQANRFIFDSSDFTITTDDLDIGHTHISLAGGGLSNADFVDGGYLNAWITGTATRTDDATVATLPNIDYDTVTNIAGRLTETWYEIQGVTFAGNTLTVSAANSVWTNVNPATATNATLAAGTTFTT